MVYSHNSSLTLVARMDKELSLISLLQAEDWTVAEFIVPNWGDKVNSGIVLSYGAARLHHLAGWYTNPMPESTISPVRDYEFSYWTLFTQKHSAYGDY
jgi:hypothetical protein